MEYPSSSEINFEVGLIVTLEKKSFKIVTLTLQFHMNEHIRIGTSVTRRKWKSEQVNILLLLLYMCFFFRSCFFLMGKSRSIVSCKLTGIYIIYQ